MKNIAFGRNGLKDQSMQIDKSRGSAVFKKQKNDKKQS